MAYDVEFERAKELYAEGKYPENISIMTGVPKQTIYRWIKENDWKQQKTGRALNMYDALDKMLTLVGKKIEELATTEGIDERGLKSVGSILQHLERLEKKFNRRGNILLGINEFTEFKRERHPEGLKQWTEELTEFVSYIRTKYPEK